MFQFIKKCFFIGSLFLSSFVSTTALSCISMNNQACKARPEIINVNSNNPVFYPFSIKVIILYFTLLVSKQVNVVAIVIILMIHMRKYVFLML